MADEPTELEIVKPRVNVLSGNRVLGYVTRGSRYKVHKTDGAYYLIEIRIGGRLVRGYVPDSDVRLIGSGPASPASTDPTPGWLRVTAATADVSDDETVLRTIRRGEVHGITGTRGGQVRIEFEQDGKTRRGWIAESDIEKLPQRLVGPSLDQRMPASISTATLITDWAAGTLVLRANPPLAGDSQVQLAPNGGPIGVPATDVQRAEAGIEIEFPSMTVHQALRTGTRSLWLVETLVGQTRHHRIDLPPLDLATKVGLTRSANPAEGLVLTLDVTGLLPGFVVEHVLEVPAGSGVQHLALDDNAPTLPRVLDVAAGEGTAVVLRVGLLRATGNNQEIVHLITIRNPDGSWAQATRVRRRGDLINGAVQVVSAAKPRPVDSAVSVPAVELMAVDQARRIVGEAGLTPRLVNATDGSPVGGQLPPDALVLRQGLVAGSAALPGDPLVLEVGDESAAMQSTSSSLEFVSGGLDTAALDAADATADATADVPDGGDATALSPDTAMINTGDTLQFIDISQSGLIGGDEGLSSVVGGNQSNPPENTPLSGDLQGNNVVSPDPGNLGNTLIHVNPDPGVLLDPSADPGAAVLMSILKVVIDAILKQPDPHQLPGPIGQAITQAIQAHEQDLQSGDPAKLANAVAGILGIVVQRLQLTLNQQQTLAALNAWRATDPQTGGTPVLDRNLNGVAADDVVIYFVGWLAQRGLYNPASNTVIGNDALGNTIALLSHTPHSPDWLNAGSPPIVISGSSKPPVAGPPPSGPPTIPPSTDPLASIPAGKPQATAGDGPDEVRIPDVKERIVSAAKPELDGLGLKISNLADLFDTDRVEASDPEQGTWVAAGSGVALHTMRQVPDVTRLSLADADQLLRKTKLEPRPVGESERSDIVIDQSPAAGSFAASGQAVKLTLAVQTPSVVGLLLNDAENALQARGLGWSANTKAFTADKVVEQAPPAGALVGRGDRIGLVLHVAVPDVRGLSLAKARETLQNHDLKPEYASDRAHDKDTVRGQSPEPKTYVRHEDRVRLAPIVSVLPDVRGRTLADAVARLRDEERYLVETIGTLLPTDVITAQTPAGGTEFERGRTVSLDARVKLPDYVGDNLLAARDAIGRLGGGLSVQVAGQLARTDVVYSQSPQGNSLAPPRTEVTLVPGVRVPNFNGVSTGRANEMLQSVGLRGTIVLRGSRETTNRSLVGQLVVETQSPRPGLYRRSDVDLVQLGAVRMDLALRTVPNVIRQRGAAAAEQIERAGLAPVIVYQGRTYNRAGWAAFVIAKAIADGVGGQQFHEPIVTSQNPQAGASVEAGSQVRIQVDSPMYR